MMTCSSILLAASLLAAAPDNQDWTSDYGAALEATRRSSRPLVVVLENPADPEQQVEPQLFSPAGFTGSTLQRYHRCRIDVSTDYGQQVADAFRTTEFPSTVIIDPAGRRILYRQAGHLSERQWDAVLTRYQDGICFT